MNIDSKESAIVSNSEEKLMVSNFSKEIDEVVGLSVIGNISGSSSQLGVFTSSSSLILPLTQLDSSGKANISQ